MTWARRERSIKRVNIGCVRKLCVIALVCVWECVRAVRRSEISMRGAVSLQVVSEESAEGDKPKLIEGECWDDRVGPEGTIKVGSKSLVEESWSWLDARRGCRHEEHVVGKRVKSVWRVRMSGKRWIRGARIEILFLKFWWECRSVEEVRVLEFGERCRVMGWDREKCTCVGSDAAWGEMRSSGEVRKRTTKFSIWLIFVH